MREAGRSRDRPAGTRGGLPRPSAGAAAVGCRAEDGGDARRSWGSSRSATWPRSIPRASSARLGTHGHDLQRLARGDRRSGGGGGVGRGQEPGPGAHLRPATPTTPDGCGRRCSALADGVARRLRSHGLRARTVTLKYRDEDFQHDARTRARCRRATDSGNGLFRVASELFAEVHRGQEGAASRRLRVPLRRREATARPLRRARGLPSPMDRVRDAVAEAVRRGGHHAREPARPPRAQEPLRQAPALSRASGAASATMRQNRRRATVDDDLWRRVAQDEVVSPGDLNRVRVDAGGGRGVDVDAARLAVVEVERRAEEEIPGKPDPDALPVRLRKHTQSLAEGGTVYDGGTARKWPPRL